MYNETDVKSKIHTLKSPITSKTHSQGLRCSMKLYNSASHVFLLSHKQYIEHENEWETSFERRGKCPFFQTQQ